MTPLPVRKSSPDTEPPSVDSRRATGVTVWIFDGGWRLKFTRPYVTDTRGSPLTCSNWTALNGSTSIRLPSFSSMAAAPPDDRSSVPEKTGSALPFRSSHVVPLSSVAFTPLAARAVPSGADPPQAWNGVRNVATSIKTVNRCHIKCRIRRLPLFSRVASPAGRGTVSPTSRNCKVWRQEPAICLGIGFPLSFDIAGNVRSEGASDCRQERAAGNSARPTAGRCAGRSPSDSSVLGRSPGPGDFQEARVDGVTGHERPLVDPVPRRKEVTTAVALAALHRGDRLVASGHVEVLGAAQQMVDLVTHDARR